MSLTTSDLRGFLASELGISLEGIGDDEPILTTGIVDSFAFVSLVTYIAEKSGTVIDPDDVSLADFNSLSRIIAFLNE